MRFITLITLSHFETLKMTFLAQRFHYAHPYDGAAIQRIRIRVWLLK